MSFLLSIKNLHAVIADQEILKGVDLEIEKGQIHFLMGPNGSGKSTLAQVLMGSSHASVTQGEIFFQGENVTSLAPEERARRGLYLGFQYPAEVTGVGMIPFLRGALASRGVALSPETEFRSDLAPLVANLGMSPVFLDRNVNEGFSGGEKKRSEIFQLQVFKPTLAVLDEFDSGLDVDGLRSAAASLKDFMNRERALLVITHYGKIIDYLKPDAVHIMLDGRIVKRGDKELVGLIEESGFGKFSV